MTFSKKYLGILLIFFILAFNACFRGPLTEIEEVDLTETAAPRALETTTETTCESDGDCWCRVFSGKRFLPGRRPGHCCKKLNARCVQIDRCAKCLYR